MKDKSRIRLDQYLVECRLVPSRHRAADLIRRRMVKVNHQFITRPAYLVDTVLRPRILVKQAVCVSRAGDKLAGVSEALGLDFIDTVVLDVGAHRGGFTDYVLRQKARLVITVDVGRQCLAPSLRNHPKVISFQGTDIRSFQYPSQIPKPNYILVDLSFISLRKVTPALLALCGDQTRLLLLLKPQFEGRPEFLNKGVVKNHRLRRQILSDFEAYLKEQDCRVLKKSDAPLPGAKGNKERFYLVEPPNFKR